MFVPLWFSDEKSGFILNAANVDFIRVREIPDTDPIRYGFEVFFSSGGSTLIPGQSFLNRDDAIEYLISLITAMDKQFKGSLIDVLGNGLFVGLRAPVGTVSPNKPEKVTDQEEQTPDMEVVKEESSTISEKETTEEG